MSLNLFTLASNDQSVYYLGQIFGNIPGILPLSNAPALLGILFKILNTAALSVGAMIVTYTTVVGLLATASEGEFLGKKWSGLWVPVRTVLGIVGLFPSAGGYCAIQMIIMWLILQGVGLADNLWTATMGFMEENHGSPYARVDFPNITTLVTKSVKDLFTGLVCRESMLSNYTISGMPSSFASYYCAEHPSDQDCRSKALPELNPKSGSYNLGFGCGAIEFRNIKTKSDTNSGSKPFPDACIDPQSLSCALAKAQVMVLPGIISVVDTIAKKFVQMDYEYQNFYYTSDLKSVTGNADTTPEWIKSFCTAKSIKPCCAQAKSENGILNGQKDCPSDFKDKYRPISSNEQTDSVNSQTLEKVYIPYGLEPYLNNEDFIAPAVNQYVGALTEAYTNYLATMPPPKLSSWRQDAEKNGWILAGMYYYTIAKENAAQQVSMDKLALFNITEPEPHGLATQEEPKKKGVRKYRNNLRLETNTLFSAIQGQSSSAASSYASPGIPKSSPATQWMMENLNMLHALMNDLTKGDKNPLAQLAASGYKMMYSAQILFWATLVIVSIAAVVGTINFVVLGSGMTANPALEYAKAAWGMVSPFFILMIVSLYSMGAIIGIYLPLLPYIIFTMGAIGWMMTTLEAMVAGPLIALGILSPSGQHELLGKAEPAVMILFNLILRPGLMIFGMMASMFVAIVVIKMINTGFSQVAYEVISSPGIFEALAFFVVYVSLVTMALNKVFSLIHVIPEKVLMYIGGQAISYSESEGLAGAKQALEGSAGAITGASKESGSAATSGILKARQDEKVKEKAPKDPSLQAGKGEGES
ncbi:MAG: hypothetical protein K0R24_1143 [Gammaproteobacteria bacterium]|jgi:hypothetical protein|nr:hypothetical protein [Gammaproteobacteria bacterium]